MKETNRVSRAYEDALRVFGIAERSSMLKHWDQYLFETDFAIYVTVFGQSPAQPVFRRSLRDGMPRDSLCSTHRLRAGTSSAHRSELITFI